MRDPLDPQTWQLVKHGGDRTESFESSMSEGPYRGEGHAPQKGSGVEHPTEREARQGSLAVYDRRCTCETEKTLSDSFNVTKHQAIPSYSEISL